MFMRMLMSLLVALELLLIPVLFGQLRLIAKNGTHTGDVAGTLETPAVVTTRSFEWVHVLVRLGAQ